MRPVAFVIPGDLALPTGGYGYDRQVLARAAARGCDMRHVAIPGGYPFPDDTVLAASAAAIAQTPPDALLLIDGLAYGAMPVDFIRSFNRPIVELCHHPLALEPGVDAAVTARLATSERAAMALAAAVIVTGRHTAGIVARDFDVAPEKISVALPGTEPAPRARGSGGPTPRLIAVGSVIPRKAYDVLVTALSHLRHLPWTLEIAGALTHAPDTVIQVQNLIQELQLENRIHLLGPLAPDELDAAFDRADLFVMSSLFEGYGMVIAEAMARGLPIVATTGGAAADTLDDRAGLKVPPNSIQALAEAIQDMLSTDGKRKTFSDGSWLAGQSLPTWDLTLDTILDALRRATP